MMSALLELSLRGAVFGGLVFVLDLLFGRWLQARHRRAVWLLAPIAFLLPFTWHLPVLPSAHQSPVLERLTEAWPLPGEAAHGATSGVTTSQSWGLFSVWLAGVVIASGVLVVRTVRTSLRWDGCRFSTDGELLTTVEDCRHLAGVRAPVGVIMSERIASPALLGWLRPKILLPAGWVSQCPPTQLRDVLLHELAHQRHADLAWGWLFAAMRIVHWFNPVAHLAVWRWQAVREDAADELALTRRPTDAAPYEETLLILARRGPRAQPFGALGISESFIHLKHRILMIQKYPRRVVSPFVACLLVALLALGLVLRPTIAEPSEEESKKAAETATLQWLKGIDDRGYAKSWADASEAFRKQVTEEQWGAAMNQVRKPLGACKSRKLGSALLQDGVPLPDGKILEGLFVIAQFRTSFENLVSAIETVTFEREKDGAWRASGYFIKPD
jgi:beta-lactamase regulating signal transducer with metallopeptidase domain